MDMIRPIRTDEELAAATAEIERLWRAEPGTPEHDRLEVLGVLVAAYEDQRFPIDPPDPIEALKARMDQEGYTQADLAELLGSRSRASEILGRRRHLTMDMVWKLSRSWGIPADILIQPYELAPRAA
jgi:HTH-type transcriptional regulator/antitoxin HigA